MKQKKYTIRKISVGILGIIFSISSIKVASANAVMETDNKVIIDENGVRPDVEPILPENTPEKSGNKPPVKPTEKPDRKPPVGPEEKPTEKPDRKPPVKPEEKPTEKPSVMPDKKPSTEPDRKPLVEPKEDKTPVKQDDNKFPAMSDKEKYHDVNKSPNKDLLVANLSGRDLRVEYKKGSISADKLYVESLNDNKLNKSIENKLGNDYKVIETFEIHFEKDDKKVDSNEERTVKIAITKKDNTELEVYHITNDISLEKVNSKYSEGELQFNINHFSKFTIVERIKICAKNLEERAQVIIPERAVDVKKEELPETLTKKIDNVNKVSSLPKTGIKTLALEVVGVMLILAAILIRREQKNN
ncbi:LPXTG cell wall anchor domain-containing protein [Gemella taiwanensis]